MGFALTVAACGGAEREAKAEADRVLRAVARLREAPNEAKAELLPELSRLSCKDAEVCEALKVCTAAYERHVRAIETTARVKRRLDADAGPADAPELAALLGEAERELGQSRAMADRCAELEGALRRRFKL